MIKSLFLLFIRKDVIIISNNTFFLSPDYTKEIPKPVTYLCNPNKQIIFSLYNEIEPELEYKLNNINECSFNIPVFVEDTDYFNINGEVKLIKNPLIDLIQPRFLILVEYNNTKEYFQISILNDVVEENKDYISVKCYSLGYELKDFKLINYNTVSSTLRQILLGNDNDGTKGILYDTLWTVGYIDKKYDDIYRGFENYNGSVLQAILDLEDTFEYIVEFDTENCLLNFYYKENYGKEIGITFDYEHYLKTLNRERNSDSMCTRLRVYGKDNLSIENYNPTGQNYIEDFTYFMYPIEMDREGNVLKHSAYMMSDDLCKAITIRMAKIIQYRGIYFDLYNKKNTYSDLKVYKEQELASLNNELQIFSDKLVVAKGAGNSVKEILDIKLQIEEDISNKENEIEEIKNVLEDINQKMIDITIELSDDKNFTINQQQELKKYIIYDKLENKNCIDAKDLYQYGLKQMELKNKPSITIKTDFINFLECIEEQILWDKIKLGDRIFIKYPLLNINTEYIYGTDSFSPNDLVGDL